MMYAAVGSHFVTVQGFSLMHAAVCSAGLQHLQHCSILWSGEPVGAINVGPRMEPPQQQVMYDLVGFLVWAGGNEVSSARFRTYASAPSGTWYCFNEGENVQQVCY